MALLATGRRRRQRIAEAISNELDRQARAGAIRIDVDEMAAAIDRIARGGRPDLPGIVQMRRARRPDQLNATNDG